MSARRRDDGYALAVQPEPATVVVVDDEQRFREELAGVLVEEGVSVLGEAEDGAAGVALATRLAPDVVLMDLRMPEMGGVEATRHVRGALRSTQVIVLSAYEDASLQYAALESGAFAYLVKGCSVAEILDAVEAARRLATEERAS